MIAFFFFLDIILVEIAEKYWLKVLKTLILRLKRVNGGGGLFFYYICL